MSKYAPLTSHLKAARARHVPMAFREIESVLGFKLPKSARKYRPWWSNETDGSHVQAQAWRNAGYQVADVDMADEKLVFVRLNTVDKDDSTDPDPARSPGEQPVRRGDRHAIFGAMKGMIHVRDGVDLTAPADADWADLLDARYGRPVRE